MKRLARLAAALFAALFLGTRAYAEEGENLLKDYDKLEWSGSALEYSAEHKTLAFSGEADAAYRDFPAARGLMFYCDCGSYKGEAGGFIRISFISEDGEELGFFETKKDPPDGSFHRYKLGEYDSYIPIPENAEYVRVSLCGSGGSGSPYFRNLSLVLSDIAPLTEEAPEWSVSGKLELVQVRVTKSLYWIWTAIIIAVPLLFFALRKALDRAKKLK